MEAAELNVSALWRYPVKSLQGERLDTVEVTGGGLAGDRRYGIVDCETGLVLTARREPRLLFASASLGAGDTLTLTLPDGSVSRDDADLSAWLGHAVELREQSSQFTGRYETILDVDNEETAEWFAWDGPAGPFHDSTQTRVSLVSEATMRDWDPRRFRQNVWLSGDGEDDLVGTTVRLGDAELDVKKRIDRCVMVTRPQPDGIDRDLDVLRIITAERGGDLGIGALVTTPGRVSVGDVISRM